MNVPRSLCVVFALSLAVTARTQESPEDRQAYERELADAARWRDGALENLKQGKPLIALDWRRDAAGDLEFRIAGEQGAKFERWFAKGLREAVDAASLLGSVMFFVHDGDALSLTHGEHHLRRLGIPSTSADLAKFVRAPLPAPQRDLALLDRLVAIDVLARRGDDDARAARSAFAADAVLDATLRERAAAAKVQRRTLDAATLPLPAQCDLVVVCNHGRLFDALPVVEIAHTVGQVSSMMVLQMLKRPQPADAVLGQVESEFATELPFELARRFGNFRLDQTVVALRLPREGDDGGWIASSAGHFQPAMVAKGVAASKAENGSAKLADDVATATIDGKALVVTDTLATARTPGMAASPRPELAARLIGGDVGLRAHVPTGSSLLAEVQALGIEGVESIDATLSCGDPITLDAVLVTKDNPSAVAASKQVKDQVVRFGLTGILTRFVLSLDRAEARPVTVQGNEVRVHLELPRSKVLTPAMVRQRAIEEEGW